MGAAVDKMRGEGLPELASQTFAHYEQQLRDGEQGMIRESEIEPLVDLPDAEELPAGRPRGARPGGGAEAERRARHEHGDDAGQVADRGQGRALLPRRDRAPGARPARAARRAPPAAADEQLRDARRHAGRARRPTPSWRSTGCRWTSSRARCRSCARTTWSRSRGPPTPRSEWAPPGHGDVYASLATSGMLDVLLERGYRYLFLSNSDNLGAVLDPRILGWFAGAGAAVRVGADRPDRVGPQGRPPGAAACRTAGWCCARRRRRPTRTWPPSRTSSATASSTRTTSGWTCEALRADARGARRRARAADDREPQDGRPDATRRRPDVIQLETAMGAAIGVFEGAAALRVPRSALRAGQDDQPAAGGALRRVRAGGRLDRAARRGPDPGGRARLRRTTSCWPTSRRASPAERRRCASAGGSRWRAT